MKKILLLLLLIITCSSLLFAYTVKGTHPRIYINSDNIATLRLNAINYDVDLYNHLVGLGNSYVPSPSVSNIDAEKMLILAYLYQMNKDGMLDVAGVNYNGNTASDYGNAAVTMLMYNIGLGYWSASKHPVIYDWCWDLMTQTQKEDFAQYGIGKEGYDGVGTYGGASAGNEWTGAPPRNGYSIIAGLAMYGDNLTIDVNYGAGTYTNSNQACIVYCDCFLNRWVDEIIPAGNMSASNDGGWGSGTAYDMDYINGYMKIMEAWRTATGEISIYENNNRIKYTPQMWFYLSKSYIGKIDGIAVADYDDISGLCVEDCRKVSEYAQLSNSYRCTDIAAIGKINNILGDTDAASLCEWILDHKVYSLLNGLYSDTGPYRYGVYYMLWHDGSITAKSPTTLNLPLTKIFGDAGETHSDDNLGVTRRAGTGWVVMRTKWEDENALQLAFRASPWFYHGHQNWKEGTFHIGYKGELALLDSGNYEDGGQDSPYYSRTISGNTMIVYDSSQTYQNWTANDGGQCQVYRSGLNAYTYLLPGTMWERPGITKFISAATYDYMEADLARNYNIEQDGTDIEKLNSYTRNFIWLKGENPDSPGQGNYVVVVDKVDATNSAFKKRWLLHSVWRPELDGSETFEVGSDTAGISVSADTTVFAIKRSSYNVEGSTNTQLLCKTILPEGIANYTTRIVGGPDYRFMDAEYINHPLEKSSFIDYLGSWRVEIQPTVEVEEDLFLHVLHPCEVTTASMPTTIKIESSNSKALGTHIAVNGTNNGWCVMFSTNTIQLDDITYTINDTGDVNHLICDLKPNTRFNVLKGGAFETSAFTPAEGTLYFEDEIAGEVTYQILENPHMPEVPSIIGR